MIRNCHDVIGGMQEAISQSWMSVTERLAVLLEIRQIRHAEVKVLSRRNNRSAPPARESVRSGNFSLFSDDQGPVSRQTQALREPVCSEQSRASYLRRRTQPEFELGESAVLRKTKTCPDVTLRWVTLPRQPGAGSAISDLVHNQTATERKIPQWVRC